MTFQLIIAVVTLQSFNSGKTICRGEICRESPLGNTARVSISHWSSWPGGGPCGFVMCTYSNFILRVQRKSNRKHDCEPRRLKRVIRPSFVVIFHSTSTSKTGESSLTSTLDFSADSKEEASSVCPNRSSHAMDSAGTARAYCMGSPKATVLVWKATPC